MGDEGGGWDGRERGSMEWEEKKGGEGEVGEGRKGGMAPLSQDLFLGLAHKLSLRPTDRDLGYSFP